MQRNRVTQNLSPGSVMECNAMYMYVNRMAHDQSMNLPVTLVVQVKRCNQGRWLELQDSICLRFSEDLGPKTPTSVTSREESNAFWGRPNSKKHEFLLLKGHAKSPSPRSCQPHWELEDWFKTRQSNFLALGHDGADIWLFDIVWFAWKSLLVRIHTCWVWP